MLNLDISVFDRATTSCFHLRGLDFVEMRRRVSPIDKAKKVAALVAEAKRLDCAQIVCDPIPRGLTFSERTGTWVTKRYRDMGYSFWCRNKRPASS